MSSNWMARRFSFASVPDDQGVKGANGVKGLRTWRLWAVAELVYGHVRKGSRLAVIGHIQQRKPVRADGLRNRSE